MERWIADQRYFLTHDRSRAVPENDPEGAFLLIGPGGELPEAEARKYGLLRNTEVRLSDAGGENSDAPPAGSEEQSAQSGPVSITRDPESGNKVFTLGAPSSGATDQGSSYDLPRPEQPDPQSESGITPAANAGSDTTSQTPSTETDKQTVTMQNNNESTQTASTGQATAGKAESGPTESKAEAGPNSTKGKGKSGQSGQKTS